MLTIFGKKDMDTCWTGEQIVRNGEVYMYNIYVYECEQLEVW